MQGIDTRNATLARNLSQFIADFITHHPSAHLANDFKEKLINACQKIVYVLKAKYVSAEKSIQGFIRTGQHVKTDPNSTECTVSYATIMGLTMSHCTDDGSRT